MIRFGFRRAAPVALLLLAAGAGRWALDASASSQAPASPDAVVKRVVDDPKFAAAKADLDRNHDRLVNDIIALTEIPAPSFKEDKRGAAYLELLKQAGLQNASAMPKAT
jgi:hypothetical protein